MEDWQAIAAEVAEALGEVGYAATLHRTAGGSGTPWGGAPTNALEFPLTVLEDGMTTRYGRDAGGALIPRTVRALTISATGEAPRMGDRIELPDGQHEILRVSPLQPGGVALLFEVEIAI